MTQISELLRQAAATHQSGDLDGAERGYKKVLEHDPRNADALNLLGAIASARGQREAALSYFDQAIAQSPNHAGALYNKALTLEEQGDMAQAEAMYRQVIAMRPDFAVARLNLGALLQAQGHVEAAIDVFRAMTAVMPRDVAGHYNLGACLFKNKDFAGAKSALQIALSLQPNHDGALATVASIAAEEGDLSKAIDLIQTALRHAPQNAEYLTCLGMWQAQRGNMADALQAHRQACALEPLNAKFLSNLGATLLADGQVQEAASILTEATKIDPLYAEAHLNLGLALDEAGQTIAAIDAVQAALSLDINSAAAHQTIANMFAAMGWATPARFHHAQALSLAPNNPMMIYADGLHDLARGDFATGWAKLESRFELWHDPRYRSKGIYKRAAPPPYWRGESLAGKSILIWGELGLGDEILFSSLLPDVLAQAGHVTLECAPRLAPVFARSFPAARVVPRTDHTPPVDRRFDVQAPIGSLGQYLRRSFADFPAHRGYLKADAALVAQYRVRYGDAPRIGMSWRSAARQIGAKKTIALEQLAPVLQTPSVRFVNVQYGDVAGDLRRVKEALGVEIIDDASVDQLQDMDQFFAQIAALDLVITTSNTAAHVAGALGVPAWVLVPRGAGGLWYWFEDRPDSPWYPSVRLFRQTIASDQGTPWDTPIKELTAALTAWLSQRGQPQA